MKVWHCDDHGAYNTINTSLVWSLTTWSNVLPTTVWKFKQIRASGIVKVRQSSASVMALSNYNCHLANDSKLQPLPEQFWANDHKCLGQVHIPQICSHVFYLGLPNLRFSVFFPNFSAHILNPALKIIPFVCQLYPISPRMKNKNIENVSTLPTLTKPSSTIGAGSDFIYGMRAPSRKSSTNCSKPSMLE